MNSPIFWRVIATRTDASHPMVPSGLPPAETLGSLGKPERTDFHFRRGR